MIKKHNNPYLPTTITGIFSIINYMKTRFMRCTCSWRKHDRQWSTFTRPERYQVASSRLPRQINRETFANNLTLYVELFISDVLQAEFLPACSDPRHGVIVGLNGEWFRFLWSTTYFYSCLVARCYVFEYYSAAKENIGFQRRILCLAKLKLIFFITFKTKKKIQFLDRIRQTLHEMTRNHA